MYNIAVVGSRTFHDYELLKYTVDNEIKRARISKPEREIGIVSGGAKGADTLAKRYANSREDVEYLEFRPDWKEHGKAAGFFRNLEIIKASSMVIAFWDGKSKGTKHTIGAAYANKLRVKVVGFYK